MTLYGICCDSEAINYRTNSGMDSVYHGLTTSSDLRALFRRGYRAVRALLPQSQSGVLVPIVSMNLFSVVSSERGL